MGEICGICPTTSWPNFSEINNFRFMTEVLPAACFAIFVIHLKS